MIHVHTKLSVIDNSGAKTAQCIKILKNKKYAKIGDIIVVSIKEIYNNSKSNQKNKVQKGDVTLALVVRTKKPLVRKDGSTIQFEKNSVVLLHRNIQPIGTRIHGPVTHELRILGFGKTISMAERIL